MVNKLTDVCSMKLLSAVLYLDPDAVLYAQEPGSTEQRQWLLFLFWEVCGENLKIRISWDVGTPRYWIILYFLSDPNKNLKSRSCEIQPMPAEANWTVRNECNTIKWVLNLCEHCSSSGGLILVLDSGLNSKWGTFFSCLLYTAMQWGSKLCHWV